ncbi:hypothetical protein [Sphingomonas sp. 1P08PE]|uniref:hypothetical protein n=1 Tax=Sphingomonas sp. 1P08PE TaxID=554122 RepID=UPI0039A13261
MVDGTETEAGAGGTGDWCRWGPPEGPAETAAAGTGGALVLHVDPGERTRWARAATVPDAGARERFLEVLAQTSNVRLAAQAVQMSVRPFYALRQRDGAFADAWQRALAEAADMMAGDLISTLREAADAPPGNGADPKVVLAALKIQAELARSGAGGRASGMPAGSVRHVPLGAVRAEILRRLDALDPHGREEGEGR